MFWSPWVLLVDAPAGSILLDEPPTGIQRPVPDVVTTVVLMEPALERPMTPEPAPVTMDTVLDPVPTLVIVPDPEVVTAGVLVSPEPVTSAPAGVRVPVPEVVGA